MSFQDDKAVTYGNLSAMNDLPLKGLQVSSKLIRPLLKDHRHHRHRQQPHTWPVGRNKRSFPKNTHYAKLKIYVRYQGQRRKMGH